MVVAREIAKSTPPEIVCEALGVSRASLYRTSCEDQEKSEEEGSRAPRISPRALNPCERENILDLLHSERFADQAPATVYATLLDEEVYVCSVPTMYRLLRAKNETRERRKQRARTHYQKPELLANGPNELWSWDITKLLGSEKWTYYYLYVIMDVFSRCVVGWMIAPRESSDLAKVLIAQSCEKQGITPGSLTIHADRGSAMTSKPVAFLLADLGVTKTHSRPHVSNDNPYSEAQFKTLKYRPGFPERFGSQQDAQAFCRTFFAWYNEQHRHSGIAMMTPHNVHSGQAAQVLAVRTRVLKHAYAKHPERFVRKQPIPEALPTAVWINPPAQKEGEELGDNRQEK